MLYSTRNKVYVCPSPRKLSCKDTGVRISTRNGRRKTLTIEGNEISRSDSPSLHASTKTKIVRLIRLDRRLLLSLSDESVSLSYI